MPVPNPHVEEYRVSLVEKLTGPTRLKLTVSPINTAGDTPVTKIYLRRYTSLPPTEPTRAGNEDPQDSIAYVRLIATPDYADADYDIVVGSTVSYRSQLSSGVEKVSYFDWS